MRFWVYVHAYLANANVDTIVVKIESHMPFMLDSTTFHCNRKLISILCSTTDLEKTGNLKTDWLRP